MKPCQTARLYSGMRRAEDGVQRGFEQGAYRESGDDADHKACQHEKLGGKRMRNGGSCGVRGRSFGGGPKNTSRMKRSE